MNKMLTHAQSSIIKNDEDDNDDEPIRKGRF